MKNAGPVPAARGVKCRHPTPQGRRTFPPLCRAGLRKTPALPSCLLFPAGSQGPHACGPRPSALWRRSFFIDACISFVGEAYMPPGRGERSREVYGKFARFPRFVGRGLDPAAHYYRFGGRERPPYIARQTPDRPGNDQRPHRFAGGIYAAPTHRPNAVTSKKRYTYGPYACGPYNARVYAMHPANAAPFALFFQTVARRAAPPFFIFIF